MPEPATAHRHETARRFLTFRIDERLYALPAEEIAEVIRVPPVACVPQGPRSLLGLANLRGAVIPVASLRRLLGRDGEEVDCGRAIVLDGAAPVALTVDSVNALVIVSHEQLETRQAELSAAPGEPLRGAFVTGQDEAVAKVLDIKPLLAAAFAATPRRATHQRGASVASAVPAMATAKSAAQRLVTFEVAGQEYAFELDAVREIITAPQAVASDPRSEALVLGVSAYRDTLLPLLSMRGLLGFPPAETVEGCEKVIIANVGTVFAGLCVDRMKSIVAADPKLLEPPSAVLAARSSGEAQVKAIYRGEGGRRLISVLSPDMLFRDDVMQRLNTGLSTHQSAAENRSESGDLKFLVFRLGQEDFALPIGAVDEVAQVPEQITRLPKTPDFLEGVVNLRGEVLPVIDQRRRFDMPALGESHVRRLIVVRSERHRAGLIVDSVSEVLGCAEAAIEPAPELAGDSVQLIFGVINLEKTSRIVLLLDPVELLSRAERGLLDRFEAEARQDPV